MDIKEPSKITLLFFVTYKNEVNKIELFQVTALYVQVAILLLT